MPATLYIPNEPARPLRASNHAINDGLVAWFTLREDDGGVANDLITQQRFNRVGDTMFYRADGGRGQNYCLYNQAIGSNYEGPADWPNPNDSDMTILAWCRNLTTGNSDAQNPTLAYRPGTDNAGWVFGPSGSQLGGDQRLGFTLGGVADYAASTATIKAQQWQHLGIVIRGNSLTYVTDGEFHDTRTIGTMIGAPDTGYLGHTGTRLATVRGYFLGYFYDVRLFRKALSLDTIREIRDDGLEFAKSFERNRYPITIGEAPTPTETKTVWYESNEPARPLRATRGGLNEGLVMWWSFRSESGTTVPSLVRNDDHRCTIVKDAGSQWTTGNVEGNRAYLFQDGSYGWMDRPPKQSVYPITMEVVAKSPAGTQSHVLAVANHFAFDQYLSIEMTAGNRFVYYFNNASDTWILAGRPDPDTWYHIVATSRASNDHELFVNGESIGIDTRDVPPLNWTRTSVGAMLRSTPVNFTSTVAEARIYDKGVRSDEVSLLWEQSQNGYPTLLERNRYPITIGAPPPTSIVPILDHHARMMG